MHLRMQNTINQSVKVEKSTTYAPMNQVQNLPENQMDSLHVDDAFETLQCINEQIWP